MTTSDQALTRDEALAILREHREELRERFGVTELALFGSTVRNEARPDSDIDLLAEFAGECTWEHRDQAKRFIEDLFGRKVDLINSPDLFEKVRPWVEREQLTVFDPPKHWSLPIPIEKRWDMYVDDMLKYGRLSLEFTRGLSMEDVVTNDEKYMATLHALQTIGEAANKIPNEVYSRHPHIPWRDIVNARNWIAHGYEGVDPSKVWKMVTVSVPELLPQLEELRIEAIAELPQELRDV